MRYPVQIEKVDGSYVATISHPNGQFQGACEGATKDEALNSARELLEAMIAEAMIAGDEVPMPGACHKGNNHTFIDTTLAAKLLIHNEMLTSKKRRATLAKAMNVDPKQVDRILDPRHRSSLDQLQSAAGVFGKHFELKLA